MNPQQTGSSPASQLIILRMLVVLAVLLGGVIMGCQVVVNWILPIAFLLGSCLITLLFSRRVLFLTIALFVYYGTFGIIDPEVVGRIRGVFRLKDIFFVLLTGHMLATFLIYKQSRAKDFVHSKSHRPWVFFLLWLGYIFFHSVMFFGESPILAFRVGRTFLIYGAPFVILWSLDKPEQWSRLFRYVCVLGYIAIALGVLRGLGIPVSFFMHQATGSGLGSGENLGLYRFSNPAESLVLMLCMYHFWLFVLKPSTRKGLVLIIWGFGAALFLYRARLAGVAVGTALASLLVPWRIRTRAALTVLVALLAMAFLLVGFGLFAKTMIDRPDVPYIERIVEFLEQGLRGVVHGDTIDVTGRKEMVTQRWPIVKKYPLIGIGFMSPFGTVAYDIYARGGMPVGHSDIGWMDMLMRFGYIGCAILSYLFLSMVHDAVSISRTYPLNINERALCLTAVGYVVLTFSSLYSANYPTYEACIVTFSLLLAFLVHIRSKHRNNARPGSKNTTEQTEIVLEPTGSNPDRQRKTLEE